MKPRPAWDTAPTQMATVPAGLEYKAKAEYLLGYYGCEGTRVDIMSALWMDGAVGQAIALKGSAAYVELLGSLSDYDLNSTVAHECMHVLQHEVAGYDHAAAQSMLDPWYPKGLTYSVREGNTNVSYPLGSVEQNAECAIREMGFSKWASGYKVDCDDRGLLAGRAIANGIHPDTVAADFRPTGSD